MAMKLARIAFALTVATGIAVSCLPLSAADSFATDKKSCPPVGKHGQTDALVAYKPNTDQGLRNMAKRHLPPGQTPKTLTLADFERLQQDVNNAFADASKTKTQFKPTRDALQHQALANGKVSEGDLVRLSAFLVAARDEGNESVNCEGTDGFDIHINVGPKRQQPTEFDGVVAEMIPQIKPRPKGWDSKTLKSLKGKQVLVVGGLTYDNEHFVNNDPKHKKSGQPIRISLWEVHPITAFSVCTATTECDPDQMSGWTALSDWKPPAPR